MKKPTHSSINILILILATMFFSIGAFEKTESILMYCIMLGLLSISIILGQKRKLLNANNLFLAYYAYIMAIGPIVLLYNGVHLQYNYFVVVLGGLLAFAWGNFFGNTGRKIKKKKSIRITLRINIGKIYALRVLWGISVLTGLLYAYKNRSYLFSGDVQNGRVDAMAGNGMLIYLAQISIVIIPMLYELYYDSRHTEGLYTKKVSSFIEVWGMTIISFFVLILQGYRSNALTLGICLAFMIINKKKVGNVQLIILGGLGIAIVEILGMARNQMSSSTSFLTSSMWLSLLATVVVHCHNLNYVFLTFPSKTRFQYGYTYLIDFIMLKPGPDLDFTLWLKEQVGIAFAGGGRTPSILGEHYINFGFPFIFIGMFLMGIVGNTISDNYEKKGNFISVYLVWQFAHTASGGISNVILPIFINLIVYSFVNLFSSPSPRKVMRHSIEDCYKV